MPFRALVAAAALIAGMTWTDDPLTTREMRALSAAQADRRIRQDLLSILQPASRIGTGNMRRLHDTWLHTRPYATRFAGLCARDTVSIAYAATIDSKAYEDTPIRPYAVEATHSYRFAAPPHRTELADEDERGWRSPFQDECAAIGDDEWRGWFTADDPRLAMLGAFAMQATIAWAKQPGHELTGCKATDHDCANDLVERMKLDNLDSIATCDAPKSEMCYTVEAGGFVATIRARGTDIVTPADIISVEGGYQIVVT